MRLGGNDAELLTAFPHLYNVECEGENISDDGCAVRNGRITPTKMIEFSVVGVINVIWSEFVILSGVWR